MTITKLPEMVKQSFFPRRQEANPNIYAYELTDVPSYIDLE